MQSPPHRTRHLLSPTAPGRLPLVLGATALVLTLTGCSHLPESLGGTAGEGPEQPREGPGQTDGAAHDLTDAEASLRTAVERVETADDYEVQVRQSHESGDPFRDRNAGHRYTNAPEEILHSWLSAESAHVTYYTDAGHSLRVSGDDYYAAVSDPSPADEFHADPAVAAASLSQILDTSTDLAHVGEEEITVEYTTGSREDGYEEVRETVAGHGYGGTFASTVSEFAPGSSPVALELTEYPDSPFTVWLDGEGVPVRLEFTSGEFTHTHTFVGFNEGIGETELTMPAPGDPAFG
ncbi:hypothetical protein [Nocardiopsis sp. SBT366]|uniref:hypothetical protein n=1 Tax=Nocardiopsis sp. SBT366 TaxID=1580529 RepID=UPI00066BEFF3|nr:hypothetical protein [Nocardiopsis sp. SBT366]